MEQRSERGILAVSFGTSHPGAYAKAMGEMEADIRLAYPQYPLYRAWTSRMIRDKVMARDGICISGADQALEQMRYDGIREAVILPLFVLNGTEMERLREDTEELQKGWEQRNTGDTGDGAEKKADPSIIFGMPLLTSQEDLEQTADILSREWTLSEDEVLVYVGHGTYHPSNIVYQKLNEQFAGMGKQKVFIGALKGNLTIKKILAKIKKTNAKKIILAPFMLVAGDHAVREIISDQKDSWKHGFETEGYEVRCVMKGLGEYRGIRQLFLKHLGRALA